MSDIDKMKWVVGDDTGVSSRTIWAVMMGCPESLRDNCCPLDNADFGRCYRLLAQFPEWRSRLQEVADAFPEWGPLIERWDELTTRYEADQKMSPESNTCHELLRALWPETMRAAGFIESGHGFWFNPRAAATERR